MSPRGAQFMRRRLWEVEQQRLGQDDARAGHRRRMKDEHYERGYRLGKLPCQCPTIAAHAEGCDRKPKKEEGRLCGFCERGHNDE